MCSFNLHIFFIAIKKQEFYTLKFKNNMLKYKKIYKGGNLLKEELKLNSKLKKFSLMDNKELYEYFKTSEKGLKINDVETNKNLYGENFVSDTNKNTIFNRIIQSFLTPFSLILFFIAVVSLLIDIFAPDNMGGSIATVIIMCFIIIISGIIRFFRDKSSIKIYNKLINKSEFKVRVRRDNIVITIPAKDVVVGDIILISTGDKLPADVRLIKSNNLFVSQSALTGESAIIQKTIEKCKYNDEISYSQYKNILLGGTSVISGKGEGIVIGVGENTFYGSTKLSSEKNISNFEKGANSITLIFIKFIAVIIPITFIVSVITKGNIINSIIFAISAAIGLIPEILPMVITVCLVKGSYSMSKKNTVIKNINSIQCFGGMDILCMDKTGTLTNDTVIMEYYMDILGNESKKVLDYAYINSFLNSGIRNYIDNAIMRYNEMPQEENNCKIIENTYKKNDEIPFDSIRKCTSILVCDNENNKQIITKGSVNEVFSKCGYMEYNGEINKVYAEDIVNVKAVVDDMLEDGMKVIAVARKNVESNIINISYEDEKDLILMGYIAFFDAPKKSAKEALQKLEKINVKSKILTGDNKETTISICKRVGIKNKDVLIGRDIDNMTEEELSVVVEKIDIFAELSPYQKALIVKKLSDNGHTVGFIGDGINDIPPINEADVGISVDSGLNSVKEIADIILLKKDLNVLEEGIIEGRKVFANMTKYIRITGSSNFGNMLAIIFASIFLPFMPMTSIQILILNLFYDIICMAMPWDNVDKNLIENPQCWSEKTLVRFMRFFGPISLIFDILTFLCLYFLVCPYVCGVSSFNEITSTAMKIKYMTVFQSGWFIESMLTQIIIIHSLRTEKLPFIESKASKPVIIITALGIFIFTLILFTPIGMFLGFEVLPPIYMLFIIVVMTVYICIINFVKKIYIKEYGKLI